MIPRFLLPVALLIAVGVSPLRAQSADTLHLSITDAVTRALRESDESRLAAARVELADAQITTARAT